MTIISATWKLREIFFRLFVFLLNCVVVFFVVVSIVVFKQSTPVLVTNIQLVDNLRYFYQQNSNSKLFVFH